jgi:alpha-1,2-mannosyltransferase
MDFPSPSGVGSDRLQAVPDSAPVPDPAPFNPLRRVTTNRQRWFVAGLLVFFFLLSIQYSYKAIAGRSAFVRWRNQIEHLDDADIYQRFKYPNPPIMALLLEELVRLPPLLGSLTWFYLKVGMVLLSFYWVFRLVPGCGPPFPSWARVVTVLVSLRPIMGDLYHNNVNIFILFLVTGSLFASCRGRHVTSGLVLGLAIACKVTPALFIPYFLWKRAWRTLAGCAIGLVLFLVVVPGFFLGMDHNFELLSSWEKQMIEPFVVNGVVASEHSNQSLPGLAYRLFTHSPSTSKFDFGIWGYTPLEYSNWADLNPRTVQWILKACMAAFVILVIWTCRTSVASGPSLVASERETAAAGHWRLAAEFSLVLLGMLLFSERTWKHHCVTLVLPFAVILYSLAVERLKPLLRWFLIGVISAVTLLMASTSTNGVFPWWDRGAKMAQVYGAYVWAYLLLIVALVVILRRRSIESSTQILAFRWRSTDLTDRLPSASPERESVNPAESRLMSVSAPRNPPA